MYELTYESPDGLQRRLYDDIDLAKTHARFYRDAAKMQNVTLRKAKSNKAKVEVAAKWLVYNSQHRSELPGGAFGRNVEFANAKLMHLIEP